MAKQKSADEDFYAGFKPLVIQQPGTGKQLKMGSRVLITADHPWAGHTGEIVAVEMIGVLNRAGVRVRLDNGHECFVTKPGEMRAV